MSGNTVANMVKTGMRALADAKAAKGGTGNSEKTKAVSSILGNGAVANKSGASDAKTSITDTSNDNSRTSSSVNGTTGTGVRGRRGK